MKSKNSCHRYLSVIHFISELIFGIKSSVNINLLTLVIVLFSLLSEGSVYGQKSWTGATNTDWNTGSNWNPAGVPLVTQDVSIPGGLTNFPIVSSVATAKSISISSNATFTIATNGILTVNGLLTISSNGTFDMLNGTASLVGMTNSGILNVQGGTITSNVTITNSGVLNQSGGLVHLAVNTSTNPTVSLINDGVVNQTGGTINTRDYAPTTGSFNQNGTEAVFRIYRDWKPTSGHVFNSISGTVRFSGNGGGNFSLSNVQFNHILVDTGVNPGFSNTNNSLIKISGNFTNDNTGLNVGNQATFQFNGSGSQSISSNSTSNTFGHLIIANTVGTVSLSTAVANISGGLTVNSGSVLSLGSFNFGASGGPTGLILESGNVGSRITGTGTLTLSGNVTLNTTSGNNPAILSVNIALGGNRTFTVADDGTNATDLIISGVISGGFNIIKAGSGEMTLSGSNTYTGTTTISAGIIKIGAAGSGSNSPLGTISGNTIVSSGASLDLNGFTIVTTEPLSLNGTGFSNKGALMNCSTNSATYSGVITFVTAASIVGDAGPIVITGTPVSSTIGITLGGAAGGTFSSVIAGARTLTKEGSGVWVLSGVNTYTGNTIINAGRFSLGVSGAIAANSALFLNGGNFSSGNSIGYNNTVGTLNVQSSSTVNLGTGNHTLNFAASNGVNWNPTEVIIITGWTGGYNGTSGTAGKIRIGTTTAGLTVDQLAQITFFNGTNYYTATILTNGELVPTSTLFGAPIGLTYPAQILVSRGVVIEPIDPVVTGFVQNYSVVPSLPDGFLLDSQTGIITGSSLIASNISIYLVTATNFLGSTTFELEFGVTERHVSRKSGNWSDTGTWQSGIIPSDISRVVIRKGHTVTVDIPNAICFTLQVSDGPNDSELNFSGINPSLTVIDRLDVGYRLSNKSPGIINFSSGASITAGTVALNKGFRNSVFSKINMTAGGVLRAGLLIIDGIGTDLPQWVPGSGSVQLTVTNTLPSNVFTSFNNIEISSGTTTTTGAEISNITGNLNVKSGATFSLAHHVGATSTSSITMEWGLQRSSIVGTGTLTLGGPIHVNFISGGLNFARMSCPLSLIGNRTFTVASDGATTTAGLIVSGPISGSFGINKAGLGAMVLSANNSYTGITNINAGILRLGASGNATNTPLGVIDGGTVVASGAMLDLNGFTLGSAEGLVLNGTGVSGRGALTNSSVNGVNYSGVITFNTDSSIIGDIGIINITGTPVSGTTTVTIGGTAGGSFSSVLSGARSLVKEGSGTWTLSGNNTYSGITLINAGILKLGASGNSTNTPLGVVEGGTVVALGAMLDLNGFTLGTAEALSINGNGISGKGALTNSSVNGVIYSGVITFNTDSSIVGDIGTINITGTPESGTTTVTIGGTAGGSFLSVLSGARSLIKEGSGIWTLSGNNSYSGSTLINAGAIRLGASGLGSNTPLGTTAAGTIIASGATLDLNGFTLVTDEALSLSGFGVSNSGALTNSSVTAASYNGLISLTNSSSIVTHSGAINITNNGIITGENLGLTLDGSGNGSIASVIGTGSGNLTKNGTGIWTLSGANTFSGGTILNSGQLNINNPQALGAVSGVFTINGGGIATTSGAAITTLNYPQVWNGNFALSGTHSINLGSGTIFLTSNCEVTVNGNTLILGGIVSGGLYNLTKTGSGTLQLGNNPVALKGLAINGGTLIATSDVIQLSGDFINNGTFIHNEGTVQFNGAVSQHIPSVNFYNLISNNSGSRVLASSGTIGIARQFIPGTNSYTITGSTIDFNGTLDQDIPSFTFNHLTISNGGVKSIASTNQVVVNGSLTNTLTAAQFVLQSNSEGTASLIHHSNHVPATVQRYISGAAEDWHFLSSPVSNQEISGSWLPSGTYGNGTGYDMYVWNEPTFCWIYKSNTTSAVNWNTVHSNTHFDAGRGYLYSVQALHPTKTFTGNLNNGSLHYPITNEATDLTLKGFNLVGNPYPSSIDWSAPSGWSRSDLESNTGGYDMWIWNPAANNYGVFNSASGIGTNSVTQTIAPMQGFFVKANSTGNLGMNNEIRVSNGAGNWFRSSNATSSSGLMRIKVVSKSDESFDEALIQFGATVNQPGAMKLFSHVLGAPSLYMASGKDSFSVQYFTNTTANKSVPLAFKPGKDGNYSLHFNFQIGDFDTVLLEDRLLKNTKPITMGSIYRFKASKSDDVHRFVIHFGKIDHTMENELPIRISADGVHLNVDLNSVEGTTAIEVFDLTGRIVYQNQLESSVIHSLNINSKSEVLIVKLKNDKGQYIRKLFFYTPN